MIGTVTLTPNSAPRGATIAVTGSGFGRRLMVTIQLGLTVVATVRSGTKGKFSTSFVADTPASQTPYTVSAYSKSAQLEHTGSAQLTITAVIEPPPPPPPVDAPPLVSAIMASEITATSVRVSWHGSEKAQGWYEYGPTTAYGKDSRHETSLTYQDHSQVVTGLLAGTLYHYRVHAIDSAGQHTISGDQTFTTTAVVDPPVDPPPGTNPSGKPMPVGDLPGWRQVYKDDFNIAAAEGEFLSKYANCGAYPYGWRDTVGQHGWGEGGWYDPGIVSAGNSVADIHIRTINGQHRTATLVPRLAGGLGWEQSHQLYGRLDVRAKVDSMRGYKAAWLLWPMSNVWPRDGEIDSPEGDFDGGGAAFMHRQGATAGNDQDAFSFSAGFRWDVWHTYSTRWTPTSVKFYVDDVLIGTATSRIPNTPMSWRIQNETTFGGYDPDDATQGHILIDWAVAYAYVPPAGSPVAFAMSAAEAVDYPVIAAPARSPENGWHRP